MIACAAGTAAGAACTSGAGTATPPGPGMAPCVLAVKATKISAARPPRPSSAFLRSDRIVRSLQDHCFADRPRIAERFGVAASLPEAINFSNSSSKISVTSLPS